jgi:hypothetical protein
MSAPAAPPDLPPVPPEVTAFAAAQGVASDVGTVLKMTRRLFPRAPLRMRLGEESDASDSHIRVEVDVTDYPAEQIDLVPVKWADELFNACDAGHVWAFRLALV